MGRDDSVADVDGHYYYQPPFRAVLTVGDNIRSESPKKLSHNRQEKWDTGDVLLDPAIAAGKIDFAKIFDNTQPVELEIGTGKGTFLLARAAARPDVNFLGLDWAAAYCPYAASRLHRAGLTNARILHAKAEPFVQSLADSAVWRMHIYFPDPWPKQRHHRRRLLQTPFLKDIRRILAPGGQLCIVTDHLGYFLQIRRAVANMEGFVTTPMPDQAGEEGELVGTNYERKYIVQKRPFYSIAKLKYE